MFLNVFFSLQRKIKEEWAERERKEKEEEEAKEKKEAEKREKQVICTDGLISIYPEEPGFVLFNTFPSLLLLVYMKWVLWGVYCFCCCCWGFFFLVFGGEGY